MKGRIQHMNKLLTQVTQTYCYLLSCYCFSYE